MKAVLYIILTMQTGNGVSITSDKIEFQTLDLCEHARLLLEKDNVRGSGRAEMYCLRVEN